MSEAQPVRTPATRAAAKLLGPGESSLRKAEAEGRISREEDGTWDVARLRREWIEGNSPKPRREAEARTAPTVRTGVRTARRPVGTRYAEMSFSEAKRLNEAFKAEEREVRLAERRRELIDRVGTSRMVFELGKRAREAWEQWPPRVAAEMAAELGVDPHRLLTILTRRVKENLSAMPPVSLKELSPTPEDGSTAPT